MAKWLTLVATADMAALRRRVMSRCAATVSRDGRCALAVYCQFMSRTRQPRRPAEPHVRTASVTFDVGNTWRRHGTEWAQLIFATRGAVTVHTGAGMWVVPPQRALYVPPAVAHDVEVPSGVTLRTLYMRRPLRRGLPRSCQAVHVSPLLRELLRRAFQLDTLDRRIREQRNLIEVLLDQLVTLPLTTIDLPM